MRLFDAHCDTAYALWKRGEGLETNTGHVDLRRAAFLDAYTQIFAFCSYAGALAEFGFADCADALRLPLAVLRRELEQNAARIVSVRSAAEARACNAAGKMAALFSLEGAEVIGCDPERLAPLREQGFVLATLTWNADNALAGCRGSARGLSDRGRAFVRAAQSCGVLLDVSHLGDRAFWELADCARAPIMASHSDCRALCGHPRNLTDDQLRAIRDLDGVVGLNSFSIFVDHDPAKQTVENLARHAEHMIDIMGIDHVGCGFDFFEFIEDEETMGSMAASSTHAVKGMDDASQIPNLFKVFEKMGLSQEERDKIARLNFQAVVKKTIG